VPRGGIHDPIVGTGRRLHYVARVKGLLALSAARAARAVISGFNTMLTPEKGFSLETWNTVGTVSALALDLRRTAGYIVADSRGRLVGKVECPMYGTAPDVPDALSVRAGFLSRRRRLVPADAIDQIDGTSGVIGLRVEREAIRSFL